MVELSSTQALLGALAGAREIEAQAYTLHGSVLRALEAAAARGARVVVRLEEKPYADPQGRLAKENRRLVNELRAAGADAGLGHPLHAKTIAADGTLYLDDQNWGENDLVLRDSDPAEIAAIPMRKSQALAQEAQLLRDPRSDVIVETESLGSFNTVYGTLERRAQGGAAPRLLVSERDLRGNAKERTALERLAASGVRVRVCADSEKFALAGDRVWIGSANATSAFGPNEMSDWGLCTGNPEIVNAVRARIESRWANARELSTALEGIVTMNRR